LGTSALNYNRLFRHCPSRRTTAPSFGQPPPTRRAKNTARHVRPSCVRRGWSDRLERTEQRPAWFRTQQSAPPASVAYTLLFQRYSVHRAH